MEKVRCKFKVTAVIDVDYGCSKQHEVKMSAVYGTDGEDKSFASATPYGNLDFHVTNPEVIGRFKPGDEFYLDLIPVPKEKPAAS